MDNYSTTRPHDYLTRIIFFSGKGGVSKTSISCVMAMQEKYLAEMVARFPVPIQAPLLPREVKGLDVVAELGERIFGDGHQARNVPAFSESEAR